jgi:tetratricopeptide (TPR) repeat protein
MRNLVSVAAAAVISASSAWGFANAAVGTVIANQEMPAVDGTRHLLLTNATANVFVFFRPGQEHSRATLEQVARCAKDMADKSVHWVAVVSDRYAREKIEMDIKETGLAMPVLLDEGDALYGRLGVAVCPVTGITDRDHKLAACVPFTKVNFPVILQAHIRRVLGEINDKELAEAVDSSSASPRGDGEAARRQMKLAEKLRQAGNSEKALESARKSIEKDASAAAPHILIGQILAEQGNRAEALKEFELALKLEPTNTNALAGAKALRDGLPGAR